MWNNTPYPPNPWQRNQSPQYPLINGNQGPLGVPHPMVDYNQLNNVRPGARGFNAAYNWQQTQANPAQDWFGQGQQAAVQYTPTNNPSYWDAFGHAAGTIQYYGKGKTGLNQEDLQQTYNTQSDQAQKLLAAMDLDGNSQVGEQELAAFTLLNDSPGKILWNAVQANKNNPNYANKTGLTQLESDLRNCLSFDASGNPITRPADGRLEEPDRQLLQKAVTCCPELVKAILQELKRSLNLDSAYQQYGQKLQGFENSFQAPPLACTTHTTPNNNGYNQYGNTNVPPNPWQNMNWLNQMNQMPPQQMQLVMLLMMLSSSSSGNGNSSIQGNSMALFGNGMGGLGQLLQNGLFQNNMYSNGQNNQNGMLFNGMAMQMPWQSPNNQTQTSQGYNTPFNLSG
jgi:hypothetical protein